MRRIGFTLIITSFFCTAVWGQTFQFPTVKNNAESIKSGFQALIENTKNLGSIEWGSVWTSTPESIIRHHIEYMDAVLANMTYEKIKAFVTTLRTNIDRLDHQSLSKNAEAEFDRYLKAAYPNYHYEVELMMRMYKEQPFPATINLNYDRSRLENFENQLRQKEKDLSEYRSQLAALPTLDQLRSQLKVVQDEKSKPETRRNNRRLQELNNEETSIQNQLSSTYISRENLTKNIRVIETDLQRAENNRARLAAELEEPVRRSYIDSIFLNIYNFYSWEAFFKDENTIIRDYFVLHNVRENLSNIVDEIPQRQAAAYKVQLDAFCAEWGI